jgi:serine/threonine protein kinase
LTVWNRAAFHHQVATGGPVQEGDAFALGGMIFDGRFRIEERIAEGGFAVVYRACQVALDRRVALKILKPRRGHDETARAEFRETFAAEARTIARLRHPHIVDVYDFSVSALPSGELAAWMALEWLEGETLATHLARRRAEGQRGRAPLEALAFVRPVLQALAHAHKHAIVHRDIKPANIMVTQTAHGPSLRVLDFGIAKIMADDRAPATGHTRTESVPAFSPSYAAPEQVAFSRTGPWTDVHGLGLILTELLTDEAPFSDAHPDLHVFEQVMLKERPTPASKGRDVGILEPVIAKAMALSPKDRWKDAGELLAALDDAAAGKQMASPAAPLAEARPRPSRSKIFAAGLLALLVGGGIAVGIGRASRRAAKGPAVEATTQAIPSVPAPPPVPVSPAPPAREAEPPAPAPPPPVTAGLARKLKTKKDVNARASAKAAVRDPSGRTETRPAAPKDLFDDIR